MTKMSVTPHVWAALRVVDMCLPKKMKSLLNP